MVGAEFDEAISDIEYAKLSDAEKRYYIARMDYLRDQHAIMTENVEYASREARAKALIEGREEGREEGRQEGITLGEIEAKRKVLLKLAAKKFGPALAPAEAALQSKLLSLGSVELDAMIDRVIDAQTVAEIL
jgi:predicted transposase YdaD